MADKVTTAKDSGRAELLNMRPVQLPFDPKELMTLRVRPAQFASMCGVSRQTVSQWMRKGWITALPDGLIDPAAATRQLLKRADPARVRARIFREATQSLGQLRARIRELESTLAQERKASQKREELARNASADDASHKLYRLMDAIGAQFDQAQAAHVAGELAAWLDDMASVHYYGHDLAQYRDDEDVFDDGDALLDDVCAHAAHAAGELDACLGGGDAVAEVVSGSGKSGDKVETEKPL